MTDLKRRSVLASAAAGAVALGATAAAKAAEFGNPDRPLQGSINSTPAANSEPGPQNPQLRDVLPSFNNPPPTDVVSPPLVRVRVPAPMPVTDHRSGGPDAGHCLSRPVSLETLLRSGPCHCGQSPAAASGLITMSRHVTQVHFMGKVSL